MARPSPLTVARKRAVVFSRGANKGGANKGGANKGHPLFLVEKFMGVSFSPVEKFMGVPFLSQIKDTHSF